MTSFNRIPCLLLLRITALLACLLGLFGSMASAAPPDTLDHDGRRLALVIGNADYDFAPLRNPVNDARAMADTLERLGFDVIRIENANLGAMLDAIRRFTLKARSSDVRLFYYAGHGVQVDGRNYLIPIGSEIRSDDEISRKSADMSALVDQLGRLHGGLNILILDACRNNPFKDAAFKTADGRLIRFRGSTQSGLAAMEAPQGTLVAFSTAPGAVAMDGQNYRNSLYTRHLLDHIATPGLPVEQMFKRVRIAVAQETRRLQIPWESSSLMGDFCFRPADTGLC
ncbi:MAG TPA: caspase family protein [Rhodocyclaceae bacterium]|nr:caspase family protein [Rhodocyclaceae bacterium]